MPGFRTFPRCFFISQDDAWMVLFGEVLDVTEFIPIHPGGANNEQ